MVVLILDEKRLIVLSITNFFVVKNAKDNNLGLFLPSRAKGALGYSPLGSGPLEKNDVTNREKAVAGLDVFRELDVVEGALEERLVVVDVDDRDFDDRRRALCRVTLLRERKTVRHW